MSEHTDIILDYLDIVTDNLYMIRKSSLPTIEREKLLCETEDIAYILKNVVKPR